MEYLKELMECTVCYEVPRMLDHRVLPCQHIFCVECLLRVRENSVSNLLRCPECRKLVPIEPTALPFSPLWTRLYYVSRRSGEQILQFFEMIAARWVRYDQDLDYERYLYGDLRNNCLTGAEQSELQLRVAQYMEQIMESREKMYYSALRTFDKSSWKLLRGKAEDLSFSLSFVPGLVKMQLNESEEDDLKAQVAKFMVKVLQNRLKPKRRCVKLSAGEEEASEEMDWSFPARTTGYSHSIYDVPKCCVCLEKLNSRNRMLSCDHTFCVRCINTENNNTSSKREVVCPKCCESLPKRFCDLPSNVNLMRLLEVAMKCTSDRLRKSTSSKVIQSLDQLDDRTYYRDYLLHTIERVGLKPEERLEMKSHIHRALTKIASERKERDKDVLRSFKDLTSRETNDVDTLIESIKDADLSKREDYALKSVVTAYIWEKDAFLKKKQKKKMDSTLQSDDGTGKKSKRSKVEPPDLVRRSLKLVKLEKKRMDRRKKPKTKAKTGKLSPRNWCAAV